jgi:hypothetical protein
VSARSGRWWLEPARRCGRSQTATERDPRRQSWFALLAALAALGAARPAGAGALPAPGAEGWQPLEFRSIDKHTRYEVAEVDGKPALRAASECAASALLLPLDGVDLAKTPRLRWRWKVLRALDTPAGERTKPGDDFAARVYVTFEFVPERASLVERARYRLGASLYGDDLPGTAVNYVWSRAEPAGNAWDNPFVASNKMVSLGPGVAGEWRTAEVDVLADYRRLFAAEPPRALFVALMTDADNTCTRAEALYSDFELLP